MEAIINKKITEYIEQKGLSLKFDKDYKSGIFKTKDPVIEAELLKEILVNTELKKEDDYDSYHFVGSSFRMYINDIVNSNDIDLYFSYLLDIYHKNIETLYKFISIFNELVCVHKKLNVKEPSFSKYNSDEIKIFSKYILYSINREDQINFDKFIYIKHFDFNKLMDIKQKKQFPSNESKIIKLLDNFEEILKIFDEIYDTKLLNDLSEKIIEYDKIDYNRLFFTDKDDKFKIQIFVKKEYFEEINILIKKIKNIFKDIEITLYVDQFIDNFYLLLKDGFISNLILKDADTKNTFILKNNKDLVICYDYENEEKSKILVNKLYENIKKLLPESFKTLFFIYNQNHKFHKVILNFDLSKFGYFIKDRVMQNYFSLSEYNEEKNYYTIYLYSKNNKLCYDIYCLENPNLGSILSEWLKYGNKKIINNLDSLILINGYNLILKSTKLPQKEFYDKIILQINNNDIQTKKVFEEALNQKNVEFHTKNIYYVNSLNEYIDEKKPITTTTFTSYNKRGFDTLIPFFDYIYKKKPILNKKPIILQVSYFLSYKLNVFGINNKLDK